jgi:hypothetical protein
MKKGSGFPGWVDLQVNGFAGVDFNAPDLTAEAFARAVRALAEAGTAAFCPTLITGDPEMVCQNLKTMVSPCGVTARCAAACWGSIWRVRSFRRNRGRWGRMIRAGWLRLIIGCWTGF